MGIKKLKILFQEPFVGREVTFGKFSSGAGNNTFPYGIACIASYIKNRGYDVSYLDPALENMSLDDYCNFIEKSGFDLIGIGSTTVQIEKAIETFDFIKNKFPKIITVLGGVHATLMPGDTIDSTKSIDYLILGEGEKPFLQLLDCLTINEIKGIESIKGICFKNNTEIVLNPPDYRAGLPSEEIPIPLFEIFPMRKYIPQVTYAKTFPSYSIVASRGCPFECAFCNANVIAGKKVRYKPVDVLLKEIEILKQNYNAKGVMFLDSTFTLNKQWVREFCIKLMKSGLALSWACNSRVDTIDKDLLALMKKAGCWTLVFGIESANQSSLDLINKHVKVQQNTAAIKLSLKLGFYVYTNYILCLPGETEEDALRTIRYSRKTGSHLAMFYLPVPYPKTKLWQICRQSGGLRDDARWSDFNAWDFSNPVYVNPLIGKERMLKLYKNAFFNFYSDPRVWYRNIREMILLRQSPYRFWLGLKSLLNFAFSA